MSLVTLLCLLNSCANDKLPEPSGCGTDITYETSLKTIIDNSCAFTGCHVTGGNGPGDFSSYETMLPWLENGKVENRVVTQRDMPIAPGELSEDEFDLFKCWLQDNFPK